LRRPLWTPALVQPLVAGIRGAESVIFDNSAHFAIAEEPDRYREVLDSFRDESKPAPADRANVAALASGNDRLGLALLRGCERVRDRGSRLRTAVNGLGAVKATA
jgi:hypothetical protein